MILTINNINNENTKKKTASELGKIIRTSLAIKPDD